MKLIQIDLKKTIFYRLGHKFKHKHNPLQVLKQVYKQLFWLS